MRFAKASRSTSSPARNRLCTSTRTEGKLSVAISGAGERMVFLKQELEIVLRKGAKQASHSDVITYHALDHLDTA